MRNYIRVFVVLLLITLFFSSMTALAYTPRNIGLGGDHVAITGADAIYSNPAGISPGTDLIYIELGFGGGLWNNLFVNTEMTSDMIDEMLQKSGDNGLVMGSSGRGGFKLFIGPLAGFFDVKEQFIGTMSPDLAELLLKGNEIDRTYQFDGTHGIGAVYGDAGINLSFKLPHKGYPVFYIGGTYHYLTGTIFEVEGNGSVYIGTQDGAPVSTGEGEFIFKYSDFEDLSNMAYGSAVDVGIYAALNNKLNLGLSVLNMGSLKSTKTFYEKYDFRYSTESESPEDNFEESTGGELPEGLEYKLPREIKFGGSYSLTRRTRLFATYTTTSYFSGLTDNRLALGMETGPGFLPLRFGLNYSSLRQNLKLSTGLGLYLGFFKIDAGIDDIGALFNQAKGLDLGFKASIDF